jgi:hypothetical protein
MGNRLFREGGPHRIRHTGADRYEMQVSIPTDEEGRTARECPDETCSPGYFKVRGGTGITEGQETAFCPYCRHEGEPGDFHTKGQIRYAKDMVMREATNGVEDILKGALGLGSTGKRKLGGEIFSIEMSMKPSRKFPVRRPFEDEVRRDVICPHCGLDQSVYGLATWCADCGADIFLTHVEAELNVVRKMLADVPRRRQDLGRRIAAKDRENCLEDTVSIFEAVLRALVRQHRQQLEMSEDDIERQDKKTIRNAFQNVRRAAEVMSSEFGVLLFEAINEDQVDFLARIFEKRHPITHNLGVVDRKYIDKAHTAEREGREVLVSTREIEQALALSMTVFQSLHDRLFPQAPTAVERSAAPGQARS